MEFKDKVKIVRKNILMISQEDLAKKLGVAFATVNRWESGRCKPNYSAQRAFAEFCKNNNIDVDSLENA
ncbi:MAG: helix-turn-helix transcriptional regulator [Clostridiales bacterium]|nr:helix-turn-helix transcriptional regulator [Clostridiales bacterium]